ncbi:hypothetical protein FA15DRAFT_674270 [Coprinopsis marcescibilis]|uniref:Nephrocystin 3-like N-terminal domain-containing protein n=1 Tax=Coprinopsis marcescibilis TaxID=230819 RepID=A0A5C3KI50_COPMA|nr:hypothetical protein FA15DRAFT_674270 [Coprinopsis marcescibilis]
MDPNQKPSPQPSPGPPPSFIPYPPHFHPSQASGGYWERLGEASSQPRPGDPQQQQYYPHNQQYLPPPAYYYAPPNQHQHPPGLIPAAHPPYSPIYAPLDPKQNTTQWSPESTIAAMNKLSMDHSASLSLPANFQPSLQGFADPSSQHPGGMFSNAHGFQISGSHFVSANNAYMSTPNEEDLARGKKLLLDEIASSALYNSKERSDSPKCDEETRVGILEEIDSWRADVTIVTGVLCITGSAGAGKSALMQTAAEQSASKGQLAATFFFSANDPRRNDLKHFVPTIAYQIALSNKKDRALGNCIFRTVDRDPSVFQLSFESQVEELIVKPLHQTFSNEPGGEVGVLCVPTSFPPDIFIDGIDECIDKESQSQLLMLLSAVFISRSLPFKILLASRPESPLRTALLSPSGYMRKSAYIIRLNDHDAAADIRNCLTRRLGAIGMSSEDPQAQKNWPSTKDVDLLVSASSGLFVYASTVVKFVNQRRRWPVPQLQIVIDNLKGHAASTAGFSKVPRNPFSQLDNLYRNIFVLAQAEYESQCDDGSPLSVVRVVRMLTNPSPTVKIAMTRPTERGDVHLWTDVLRAGEFIASSTTFEELCQLQRGQVRLMLSDLHSLYDITFDPIRAKPYHRSVQEFLRDPTRCGDLFIPDVDVWTQWSTCMLRTISGATENEIQSVLTDLVKGKESLCWAMMSFMHYLPYPGDIVPVHRTDDDKAEWIRIMGIWTRTLQPFVADGVFTKVASAIDGPFGPRLREAIMAPLVQIGLLLGFTLKWVPQLSGEKWDLALADALSTLLWSINSKECGGRAAASLKVGRKTPKKEDSLDKASSWLKDNMHGFLRDIVENPFIQDARKGGLRMMAFRGSHINANPGRGPQMTFSRNRLIPADRDSSVKEVVPWTSERRKAVEKAKVKA